MNESVVDGVRVFWQEAPGPLSAGLVFGCGTRDESFMTIGVTHLVEQLVMGTLPPVHHDRNASVDLVATEFHATGRPDQIVAFLDGVCRGITAIPVDRWAHEAGVLQAENGMAVHPTAAALLTRRYGARDVGLEALAGPGYDRIGAEAVLDHASRFFVAGNAALWLTGPPPPDLRLPLPPGPRPDRAEPVPVAQDGPRWSSEFVPTPGVLLSGQRDPAWLIAMSVLEERVTQEARHRRGLSYEIVADVIRIGPRQRQYLIAADARDDHDIAVAGILWHEIMRLAAEGPTAAELDHEKAGFVETVNDPRWPAEEVAQHAHAAVAGEAIESRQARLDQVAAVTPGDVARRLTQALPTALIAVPPEVELVLDGVAEGGCPRTTDVPTGDPFTMRLLARVFARAWRAPRMYLTPTGLARVDPDGDVHETAFADVIGVEEDGNDRIVFAANGCIFPIVTDVINDGDVLCRAVDEGVPVRLRYRADGHDPAHPAPTDLAAALAGTGRPAWYRRTNAVAAVFFALVTGVLYLNWTWDHMSVWWVVAGAALTLWCAWDARPRRRRRVG